MKTSDILITVLNKKQCKINYDNTYFLIVLLQIFKKFQKIQFR